MLAQSFQPAADLGITEPQKDALIKTLVLLETGKLRHVPDDQLRVDWCDDRRPSFDGLFNMSYIDVVADCGTVCCIQGTAQLIGNVSFDKTWPNNGNLEELFYTSMMNHHDITTEQAARALRSYLTTGVAKWAEAVSA